jgi:hypothetical protein
MEVVTRYIAFDGKEFTGIADCMQYEANCVMAENIMRGIPDVARGYDFANGGGYIQHDLRDLLKTRNEFLEFCRRFTKHKWLQETIDKGWNAHSSWVGRILEECLPHSICRHWYRFYCIDNDGREWGDPFYANNPQKAKQMRLK